MEKRFLRPAQNCRRLSRTWRVLPVILVLLALPALGQDIEWKQAAIESPWCPRDSAGEVVYGGKMWILGGWTIDSAGNFQRLNDIWSSSDGVSWERVNEAAPWPVRNLPGAVVFRDKMWILGGCTGKESLNDVWFSTDGKNWTPSPVPAPWSARLAFGCTVYKDKLWVIGGMDMKTMRHSNDVWNSADGIHWTRVSAKAPWSPRAMFPLVELGGKLWLFGGGVYDRKSENYHDVWYTEDGVKWVRAAGDAGWAERRFHIIQKYGKELWLFGGVTDGNVNLNDVWRSRDGVAWETANKAAPWGVRHEQMCLVFDGKLWMLGGFAGDKPGESLYNDIWQMSVK
ncbi:MAG: Kelch repeat-containing protein [Candidatus Latescibacterota bacterium]